MALCAQVLGTHEQNLEGSPMAKAPHAIALGTRASGRDLPRRGPWAEPGTPQGLSSQASWASPGLVFVPSLQMYQKEKQVLEELNRRTGARLQPLSRDLF